MTTSLPPLFPHLARLLPEIKWRPSINLFMEMRLGKTRLAIRWARNRLLLAGHSAIVVAPREVLAGWERELAAHGQPHVRLDGATIQKLRQYEARPTARWVLINPEGLRACPIIARLREWRVAIIDESTLMASPKSRTTKTIQRELGRVPHRAILSGEPAPESPLNYFEQMRFVLGGEFLGQDNYYRFRQRYFVQSGYGWHPRHGTAKLIRDAVRESGVVMTMAQAGIRVKKIYEEWTVPLPPVLRRSADEAEKYFAIGDAVETKWSLVVATWLARLAGGFVPERDPTLEWRLASTFKIQVLTRNLRAELRSRPVVVWCRFDEEIKAVAEACRKIGRDVYELTGESSRAERDRAIKSLSRESGTSHDRPPIVVAQAKLARFGLDFSAAYAAIYYSNWWDWATRSQSEARIRHVDREGPALYIDIVADDTVDRAVLDGLRGKKTSSQYFMQRVLAQYRRTKG